MQVISLRIAEISSNSINIQDLNCTFALVLLRQHKV
jgi:hypothetical protein